MRKSQEFTIAIGEVHAVEYLRNKKACLKVICDMDENKGKMLALRYGAEYVKELEDVIKRKDIDVVDICLPTFLHEAAVVRAAERGKHIFCEKPIALDIDQAKRMIAIVKKHGVLFMVGQVLRFWPEYKVVKDIVDRGGIGRILTARALRLSESPASSKWLSDPKLSGGALLDLQIHDFDFLTWIFGNPVSVFARGQKSEKGAWDHVLATVSFENGIQAYSEASFMMPEGFPLTMQLTLTGTEGCVEFVYRSTGGNVEDRKFAERRVILFKPGRKGEVLTIPEQDGYAAELEYFLESIEKSRKIEIITPDEIITVMKLVEGCVKSLETGRIIDF